MKKVLLTLAVCLGVSTLAKAETSSYAVNDSELTAAFEEAEEVDSFAVETVSPFQDGKKAEVKAKNQYVGAALAILITGSFGIHRHYLGTSNNMWAAYTFSCCGIFGIVPFVDFFVLLFTDDVAQYQGNEDFFMW